MKTIPEKFQKNGFDYELVKRNTFAAIFAQKSEGRVIAYETIKIKIFPERIIKDRILESGEYYPSTEKWGVDGFTYHSLASAEKKFNLITHDTLANSLKKASKPTG